MTVLPSTVSSYAIRTAVTAVLLLFAAVRFKLPLQKYLNWRNLAFGVAVGLVVFAFWILPEQFDLAWYRRLFIVGEGGTDAVAEASSRMLVIRLFGSAFVIAIAEELFFRKWLIGFAGFWWMIVLFAIEHDRWLVGAVAGIVYGWLYLRRGLSAAIIAHMTTNLVLGLWVIHSGQWQFW